MERLFQFAVAGEGAAPRGVNMQRNERFDSADRIVRIGFWVNALLMVFKLAAGYWGRSEAVFADGIESACDFVAIFSTMVALKLGRKPFDEQHPYGHGRAENLSALLVSLVILATGGWILFNSIHTIIEHRFQTPGMIAVVAAFLTILIKEWLYRFTRTTGMELASPSLLAIAKDHRKDAITSISTLAGVSGAYFGFGILDPLAAGLTSFFILHIGYQTFRDAAHDLMDGSAPADFIEKVTRLAESVHGVEHVHDIRGRRTGQYMVIDLKLEMDPAMTVKESHAIATRVKKLIFDAFPNVGDVMIHINPHDEEHEDLIRL
jgi:cation diffusion facilitator family transporter